MRSITHAKRVLAVAGAATAMVIGSAGAAVANPNEAGNSGKFKHNSNPCQANPDHPKCPGPA